MYSKCLQFIGLTLAVVPSHQFSVSSITSSSSRHAPSLVYATKDPNNNDRAVATTPDPIRNIAAASDTIRNIAAASAIAVGLLFPTTSIAAQEDTTYQQLPNYIESTSLQLSVEITTMDFSMPSSYNSIADPGKSVFVLFYHVHECV